MLNLNSNYSWEAKGVFNKLNRECGLYCGKIKSYWNSLLGVEIPKASSQPELDFFDLLLPEKERLYQVIYCSKERKLQIIQNCLVGDKFQYGRTPQKLKKFHQGIVVMVVMNILYLLLGYKVNIGQVDSNLHWVRIENIITTFSSFKPCSDICDIFCQIQLQIK